MRDHNDGNRKKRQIIMIRRVAVEEDPDQTGYQCYGQYPGFRVVKSNKNGREEKCEQRPRNMKGESKKRGNELWYGKRRLEVFGKGLGGNAIWNPDEKLDKHWQMEYQGYLRKSRTQYELTQIGSRPDFYENNG